MKENQYYVYILASKKNGTLYIWVTNNIYSRTIIHRTDLVEWFTKKSPRSRLFSGILKHRRSDLPRKATQEVESTLEDPTNRKRESWVARHIWEAINSGLDPRLRGDDTATPCHSWAPQPPISLPSCHSWVLRKRNPSSPLSFPSPLVGNPQFYSPITIYYPLPYAYSHTHWRNICRTRSSTKKWR